MFLDRNMTFDMTLNFSSNVSFYIDTDGPLAWLISITHF